MRFRKIFVSIPLIILFMSFATSVFAQTIIPENTDTCDMSKEKIHATVAALKTSACGTQLGCKIITGAVQLCDIPFYLVYLIDLLVKLGATLCVLFIVIGGIMYAMSGISDEKEKAKKTIMNAIIGLIISTLSWIIINIIQVAVTSG